MKLCLSTLVFCLLIISCTKPKYVGDSCENNCYIYSGQVIDTPSFNPVANVDIDIKYYKGQWKKWLASTTTDENGYWKLSFDADAIPIQVNSLLLTAESDNHLEDLLFLDEIDTTKIDQNQNFDMQVLQAGWFDLDLKITNTNVKNISLSYSVPKGTNGATFNFTPPLDTTASYKIEANKDVVVTLKYHNGTSWVDTPNGNKTISVGYGERQTVTVKM